MPFGRSRGSMPFGFLPAWMPRQSGRFKEFNFIRVASLYLKTVVRPFKPCLTICF